MRIEFRPEGDDGGRRRKAGNEDGCRRLNVCLRKLTRSLARSRPRPPDRPPEKMEARLTFKTFLAGRSVA